MTPRLTLLGHVPGVFVSSVVSDVLENVFHPYRLGFSSGSRKSSIKDKTFWVTFLAVVKDVKNIHDSKAANAIFKLVRHSILKYSILRYLSLINMQNVLQSQWSRGFDPRASVSMMWLAETQVMVCPLCLCVAAHKTIIHQSWDMSER